MSDSILAHRIIAELYEQDADYENAIKISESSLELVRRVEQNWGRPLKQYVQLLLLAQLAPMVVNDRIGPRKLSRSFSERPSCTTSHQNTTSAR